MLGVGLSRPAPAAGPLRVHRENPRYFTDDSGRPILLAGCHTWPNIVDMGPTDPPAAFDFEAFDFEAFVSLAFRGRFGHAP